jgi:capsular exopolysaccharide synthesis family protein
MRLAKNGPLILGPNRLESRVAEAFRALRVNVCTGNGERAPTTVVVASARPGEGRTTTVVNLGSIAGQAGSDVVLVDADLRKPSLHHVLHAAGANVVRKNTILRGLADVIREEATIEEVTLPTGLPGVSLVPAGTGLHKPAGLITSPRLGIVLRALREQADLVLIDSPPCLEHVDAIELAGQCDAVLYVVRAGSHDQAAQRLVQSQLTHTNARMLGAVFNTG